MIVSEKLCGAVVIGRNEGERLRRCFESLTAQISLIIYVDSGSTDDSLLIAKHYGVHVVSLDLSTPFTAARARNAGLNQLMKINPSIEFVQFIDGDCTLDGNWIGAASEFLDQHTDFAVVCGRRRERFPENSIYNKLCDLEWNTPVGEAQSCGGDALIRVEAFNQVQGYAQHLIAGEEPEMCYRLRKLGWKIYRLDTEMTLHDANLTSVGQWWNRTKRSGYAYISNYVRHRHDEEGFKRKEVRNILLWAGVLPTGIIFLSSILSFHFLWAFTIYVLQIIRLTVRYLKTLDSTRTAFLYALSNVLGKFPQIIGMISFFRNWLLKRESTLIEYK
jgi:glycosyltransferase involved in cell wall biosynthesis